MRITDIDYTEIEEIEERIEFFNDRLLNNDKVHLLLKRSGDLDRSQDFRIKSNRARRNVKRELNKLYRSVKGL